jgi:hypothetical protein
MEINIKKRFSIFKFNNEKILFLLGLAIGLYFFTFEIIGLNFKYFPGDLGDGRLNLYFLEHAYQFFTGKLDSFWDAPFMYPEKSMISYSDNLLGSAPIYSFFRIVGLDTFLSYQMWYIAVTSLNYICAFYFLKMVFKNYLPAIIGAFIFAFSMALQSQLTHAQTFPRFAIPLAFLMAVKFGDNLQPKYFLFALFLLVYQIYCGIYLGFMLAVPLAIFLILVIVEKAVFYEFNILNKKWIVGILASLAISLFILLPLLMPYSARKISPNLEHYNQILHSIPTLKSYLFSQGGTLFWDFLSKIGQNYEAFWDHQIFMGICATLSFIIVSFGFLKHFLDHKLKLNTYTTPYLIFFSGLISFVLFLRLDNLSFYISLYFIPGFSSMRSLTRIINIELLFFAFATTFLIHKLMQKYPQKSVLIFAIFFVMVFFDNYFDGSKSYKTEVKIAKERTNLIESSFAQIPQGNLVSYEPTEKPDNAINYQIDAMLTAQKYGLKTVNGYTATCPGDYGMFWNEINEESRNFWLNGKKLEVDTLYVVKTGTEVHRMHVNEMKEFAKIQAKKTKIQNIINYIKTDENWMKVIKEKASQNNIPVDSMIYLDAVWVVEQEN